MLALKCDNRGMNYSGNRKLIKLTLIWITVLLLSPTGCGSGDYGPAADFALHDADGRLHTLQSFGIADADQTGEHYLLINFWASWCRPCIKEIPLLKDFAISHAGQLQVVGLAADRIEPAKAFAQRLDINYPVLYGEYEELGRIMRDYGNPREALPYTVLISPDGRIIWRRLGLLRLRDLQRLPL